MANIEDLFSETKHRWNVPASIGQSKPDRDTDPLLPGARGYAGGNGISCWGAMLCAGVMLAVLVAIAAISIGIVALVKADGKEKAQQTTEYNITEVNRIIFPSANDWYLKQWRAVFPNGITSDIKGDITTTGFVLTELAPPLGFLGELFRYGSRAEYDAAGPNDPLTSRFGPAVVCTKSEYDTYLAARLKMYTDSIPPPGQLTGAVLPPFGPVSGTVGWTHKSGRHLIAAGVMNTLLVIDADELAKYSGPMNYEQAVQRNIILARFALPINLWHEVEHYGRDGQAQDWIAVTQEFSAVTAGILFVDATDLSNIHMVNLNQHAPNGGLTYMAPVVNAVPYWGNPGTPVDNFDPSCPKFKDDGGLVAGVHFLRKEHGYVNATGRSVIWFTGVMEFSNFKDSACVAPPDPPYSFDLDAPVSLPEPPDTFGQSRRRAIASAKKKIMATASAVNNTRNLLQAFSRASLRTLKDELRSHQGTLPTVALDVYDPAHPRRIPGARVTSMYCHDFTAMKQAGRFYGVCSAIPLHRWTVFDITNLNAVETTPPVSNYYAPTLHHLGAVAPDVPGSARCLAHSITFDVSETVGYATCETSGWPMLVLDMSNVRDIRLKSFIQVPGSYPLWHEGQPARPKQGRGTYDVLYMANYEDGVVALDTYGENAANPKIVGALKNAGRTLADGTMLSIATSGNPAGGFWGVHPIHGWETYLAAASHGILYHGSEEATNFGFNGNPNDVREASFYSVPINPDNAVVMMRSVPLKEST